MAKFNQPDPRNAGTCGSRCARARCTYVARGRGRTSSLSTHTVSSHGGRTSSLPACRNACCQCHSVAAATLYTRCRDTSTTNRHSGHGGTFGSASGPLGTTVSNGSWSLRVPRHYGTANDLRTANTCGDRTCGSSADRSIFTNGSRRIASSLCRSSSPNRGSKSTCSGSHHTRDGHGSVCRCQRCHTETISPLRCIHPKITWQASTRITAICRRRRRRRALLGRPAVYGIWEQIGGQNDSNGHR